MAKTQSVVFKMWSSSFQLSSSFPANLSDLYIITIIKKKKKKEKKQKQNKTTELPGIKKCYVYIQVAVYKMRYYRNTTRVKMNFQKNDYFLRWSTNGPQVSKNVFSALERILSIWIIFVISLSHFLKHGGFWGFSSPEE